MLGPEYDVEIVEAHHRRKADAPSGTALQLGLAVARGRGVELEAVRQDGRSGRPGERPRGEIGFHAIRGGDIVGEHLRAADRRARAHRAGRTSRAIARSSRRARCAPRAGSPISRPGATACATCSGCGSRMPRLVVDLSDARPASALPAWVPAEIRALLPDGWEVVVLGSAADGQGDGGAASPEALAAVRGAEVYIGLRHPARPLRRRHRPAGGAAALGAPGAAGVRGALYPAMRRSKVILTNSAGSTPRRWRRRCSR